MHNNNPMSTYFSSFKYAATSTDPNKKGFK